MSYGFTIYDATGTIVIDYTDYITTVHDVNDYPASGSGNESIPGITEDNYFVASHIVETEANIAGWDAGNAAGGVYTGCPAVGAHILVDSSDLLQWKQNTSAHSSPWTTVHRTIALVGKYV